MARPRAHVGAVAAIALAFGALHACAGDPSRLSRRDRDDGEGGGGAGGAPLDAGGDHEGDAAGGAKADAAGDAPGPDPDAASDTPGPDADASIEDAKDAGPVGPSRLTFVHGVADAAAARVCFVRWKNNAPDAAGIDPWPASPMPFARGSVVPPATWLEGSGADLRPYLLSGDLGAAEGKGCEELLGGAPGLTVTPLAVLPAATFASGKSLLLVAQGCVGGPTHTGNTEKLVCGSAYTPSTPTAGLSLVAMSTQESPGFVGFQVMHASPPLSSTDVKFTPGFDASPESTLAAAITFGSLAPSSPAALYTKFDLGVLDQALIKTYSPPGNANAGSTTTLSQALAQGGLTDGDLVDGEGYTLVGVGPLPGLAPGAWWSPFTFSLVKNDP